MKIEFVENLVSLASTYDLDDKETVDEMYKLNKSRMGKPVVYHADGKEVEGTLVLGPLTYVSKIGAKVLLTSYIKGKNARITIDLTKKQIAALASFK